MHKNSKTMPELTNKNRNHPVNVSAGHTDQKTTKVSMAASCERHHRKNMNENTQTSDWESSFSPTHMKFAKEIAKNHQHANGEY